MHPQTVEQPPARQKCPCCKTPEIQCPQRPLPDPVLIAKHTPVSRARLLNRPQLQKPPEPRILHQPLLGGLQGQASDIKIHADHIIRVRERMNRIYAEQTGQTVEQIEKDTNRDNFLTAEEACRYGLIDRVISKREN